MGDTKSKLKAGGDPDQEKTKESRSYQPICSPPSDALLSEDVTVLNTHLKDALEKNHQWIVYDQQREAYVQSLIGHLIHLERQLSEAKQQQQQPKQETESDGEKNREGEENEQKKVQLTFAQEKERQIQRDAATQTEQQLPRWTQTLRSPSESWRQPAQVSRLQAKLSELQKKYTDKCNELSSFTRKYRAEHRELQEAKTQLQNERIQSRVTVHKEIHLPTDQTHWVSAELKNREISLEVHVLPNKTLNDEDGRTSALEQQVQWVSKELKKATDQITKLESTKEPKARLSESSSFTETAFRSYKYSPCFSKFPSYVTASNTKRLSCPKCQLRYAVSHYRDLLTHIDLCSA